MICPFSSHMVFMNMNFAFDHSIPSKEFAVSTGPSFIAGLGVGMVVLGMKALMSPLMIGMKAMLLSMFMGDSSPWDLMKSFLGFSTDEATEEQHQIDVYNPPPTNNHYEYLLGKHQGGHKHMLPSGPSGYDGGQGGNDHHAGGYSEQSPVQHSFAGRVNPILPILVQNLPTALSAPSGLSGLKQQASSLAQTWLTGNSGLTGTLGNLMQLQELQNRKQAYRTLVTAPAPTPSAPPSGGSNDGNSQSSTSDRGKKSEPEESGFKYVPATALHLDVENFDPFYSPLLSRIDSIFMHLGFNEEGCKERAVCSIYKSPVKYAPYSNLLSAQLSKHQSELKKPVNTSPKILRYFKYMKAAKDGQSALNCVDLYPQCANDTDKLTNLPMVKQKFGKRTYFV